MNEKSRTSKLEGLIDQLVAVSENNPAPIYGNLVSRVSRARKIAEIKAEILFEIA